MWFCFKVESEGLKQTEQMCRLISDLSICLKETYLLALTHLFIFCAKFKIVTLINK